MKKILTHIFLVYFLFMTTYAFVFTMTKVQWFPFISWKVLRYHYGMMAPYQGFSTMNMDLLIPTCILNASYFSSTATSSRTA